MAIQAAPSKLHWKYFLALEQDVHTLSRYIEFVTPNLSTYSIETAHLLFAAASEVDVIAKLLCNRVDPSAKPDDITGYKPILLRAYPDLPTTQVYVDHHGLVLTPWDNWSGNTNPDWWRGYKKVKHERNAHFDKASLQNTLNSMAGLLILTVHLYSWQLSTTAQPLVLKETTHLLQPEATLFRLADEHYYNHLVV